MSSASITTAVEQAAIALNNAIRTLNPDFEYHEEMVVCILLNEPIRGNWKKTGETYIVSSNAKDSIEYYESYLSSEEIGEAVITQLRFFPNS
tara:strand:+ start:1190 stop:1465 length:276 start_codon:yes stop_codon:yes gene_type:complete